MYICQLVQLQRATERSNPLPELLSTLVSLHFLATNCHHIVTADLHGISRSSVCRAVIEFTSKMCGIAMRFIKMRADSNCQKEFFNIAGEIEGLLLCDSGYPCRRFLMTPYHVPQTDAQERFNDALCRTRVIIEQTFGGLKRRFPCLEYGLRVSPERACKIVLTCAVLHNTGLDRNDCLTRETDTDIPAVMQYNGPESGSHYRDYLANVFFR